ncbi:MAG: CocE/NonD family hydrolase [Alphaproteobacteria bacterium]
MNVVRGKADPIMRTEVRHGFRIDWDVPITMDDGLVLRANVYRPNDNGKYPVIMTHGPYAKDLAWQDGYAAVWNKFSAEHPDAVAGSTNIHQSWEVHDPEQWVPEGWILIRVDSRGAGRSPGVIDCFTFREAQDYAACIDWAGTQPWSNGKVGLAGISYYAINQWHVAGLQPKHLAAMCIWEGASDFYRDMTYHGGILTPWLGIWYDNQVKSVQHGLGTNGPKSRANGELVGGPETLSPAELAKNRTDFGEQIKRHPLDGPFHHSRSANWKNVKVPFLSAASWGGQGLHPRGNYMGFLHAASKQKWLEGHGLEHWTEFYTPYGMKLQKQFFGHFLKGEKNGWDKKPPVMLRIRHVGEKFVDRAENEWPIKRTKWTKAYLDPAHMTLEADAPAKGGKVTYDGMGDGVTFFLPPADKDVEVTGPLAAKLWVSSETKDADLFLVVRLFSPDMKEIVFKGTIDPHTPIAQGWLRASHRKLDKKLSKPWQPWHTHDEKQPLTPGRVYELDVEIWPTCIVIPAGYRLALSVRGKDYAYHQAPPIVALPGYPPFNGCGLFVHTDEKDRPKSVFGGKVTIHTGPSRPSHLLLPVIPARKTTAAKRR